MPELTHPLHCPDCDEPLRGNQGRVPAFLEPDDVRVAIECAACRRALEVVSVDGVVVRRS